MPFAPSIPSSFLFLEESAFCPRLFEAKSAKRDGSPSPPGDSWPCQASAEEGAQRFLATLRNRARSSFLLLVVRMLLVAMPGALVRLDPIGVFGIFSPSSIQHSRQFFKDMYRS